MTTKIILVLMSCILLLHANSSFSQVALNEKEIDFAHLISSDTNTTLNANLDASTLKVVTANIKLQRAFLSYFGEAADNNWRMAGQNYLNRFHSNGLLTNALFTKNGQLIYTIIYGTEKNLPADVRKMIKSEYYDYSITMATEIKEYNRDIWIVNLSNAPELICVAVEDGEMEQVQL